MRFGALTPEPLSILGLDSMEVTTGQNRAKLASLKPALPFLTYVTFLYESLTWTKLFESIKNSDFLGDSRRGAWSFNRSIIRSLRIKNSS
jgi:hypothetical protein